MSNTTAAPAKPASAPPAPTAAESNSQDDIDALLAGLDEVTAEEEVRPPPRMAAPEPPPVVEEEEVFELTDEMALPDPAPAAPSAFQVDADNDVEFAEAVRESVKKEPPPPPPAPSWVAPAAERAASAPVDTPMEAPILSRATVAAVDSAFNSLAHTVLSNNARTLEDLVKEMLRPMLKSWLDDNLPQMVERIVRAEIERVSRGR